MDKETLSNYGWIVICVLVMVVMIALSSPFGNFVSQAVQSTTKGLFDVNKSALDNTGLITIDDQEFDVPNGNGGAGENGGAPVVPEEPGVPADPQVYTLSGTWVFKSKITSPDSKIDISIEYDVEGMSHYDKIEVKPWSEPMSDVVLVSVNYYKDGTLVPSHWTQVSESWMEEGPDKLIFTGSQTVSQEFYEWFTANAVQQTSVESQPTLITFTIDGTSYQAEEGMTWAQWAASEYNKTGIYIDYEGGDISGKYKVRNASQIILYKNGGSVLAFDNEEIVTTQTYTFEHSIGGAE